MRKKVGEFVFLMDTFFGIEINSLKLYETRERIGLFEFGAHNSATDIQNSLN